MLAASTAAAMAGVLRRGFMSSPVKNDPVSGKEQVLPAALERRMIGAFTGCS
jgi:hypothetical protein